MTLDEAKQRKPITVLWQEFGLPGQPGKSCRSPFREDRNPSFSINLYKGEERWRDWGTSEGGDACDFYARLVGITDKKEAALKFIAHAGGTPERRPQAIIRPRVQESKQPQRKPLQVDLRDGTEEELEQLCQLRGYSMPGVLLAIQRGHLYLGEYKGHTCYFTTDITWYNIDVRRLDGEPFFNGPKTLTPKGGSKTWPVGLEESMDYSNIMLVEGSGDFLAAHTLIWGEGRNIDRPNYPAVGVVGMMGSGAIPKDCLPAFKGKHVQVFPHYDPSKKQAGYKAAIKWKEALEGTGAKVGLPFTFKGILDTAGNQIGDLNDLLRIPAWVLNMEFNIKQIIQ
jgi:hypothetical protein